MNLLRLSAKGGKTTYTSIRLICNRGQPLENFLVGHMGGFLQANWLFPL
jgi:hypothetical protein